MITEIATITVAAGSEEAFEVAMRNGGIAHLQACPGVGAVRFGRGVEDPSKFAFVVEWESLEAHGAVRDLESFRAFRAAMGTMTVGGAMEHFTLS
ncbi:antibiotic biosynthesis monooxygenase [Novosphingobium sp. TH158]|uniref:antibiotic biosynthesis monooxygenase family protein n=1 Tax=Novosphingobium sp. TH158 TaxID=2067455 RepID=UPI000C7E004A|nr:antibiotic biosynthesis monooxygenase family protein [Novosphingobium sp. TH158]PLK27816.1 antibiotic biosynthesis monooxygenase [Novosphingobium sp. TH158]